MRILVDDKREPPDPTWIVFRSMAIALDFIQRALIAGWFIQEVALDHDMGEHNGIIQPDGTWFMTNLEKWFFHRYHIDKDNGNPSRVVPPHITFHSSNEHAKQGMINAYQSMQRFVVKK